MNSLSVVIITRNEENNIIDCIRSAKLVSDDIIVIDSGSTDNTLQFAQSLGAKTFSIIWQGYGASRNFGAAKAKHDWILALDADERISKKLSIAINNLSFKNNCIYKFRRQNYLGDKLIRFGTLGFETVKRIYNRTSAQWDLTLVHEKLVSNNSIQKLINGSIDHYGLKNYAEYKAKAILYAQKSAEKYYLEGKKTNLLKKFSSPFFNSIKSYFFRFGFLDGKLGLAVAKTTAYYSWLKYHYLHQIQNEQRKADIVFQPKPKMENVA